MSQPSAPASRPLVFKDEMTDSYSGQSNHVLSVSTPDGRMGTLEYTVFRGTPQISMVSVPEKSRRQGLATALVQQLQSQFPDVEIEWGFMTEEGAALRSSLPKRTVATPAAPLIQELAQVRERLAELERLADAGQKLSREQLDGWNDLHDRESDLESEIGSDRGFKELIVARGGDLSRGSDVALDSSVLQSALQARALIGSLRQGSRSPSP